MKMAFRALLPEECVDSERAPILSEKQMRVVYKNMPKYARQLEKEASR